MSRGGRGGGRGGWKGSKTRNYGLDLPDNLIVSYDQIPLYPDMKLPPSINPSEHDKRMFDIYTSYLKRLKSSPYYLKRKVQVKDVKRYSDRYVSAVSLDSYPFKSLRDIPTDLSFFPEELHTIHDPTRRTTMPSSTTRELKKELDLSKLDALEKQEQSVLAGNSTSGVVIEEEELAIEQEYDEDLEEDDNDYLIDYYEDDLDMVGGDGSENGDDDY